MENAEFLLKKVLRYHRGLFNPLKKDKHLKNFRSLIIAVYLHMGR